MLKSALSLFLISCLLGRLDCTELPVKQGTNATLQCSGHRDAAEIMLRWEKPDLQSDDYVFYFKDGHFQEDFQHESFKGRVEMKDPDWNKTGDFSVILKHVTTNDAGTYECHAGYKGQKPELISSVILKVEKPGSGGGQKKDGGKEEEGMSHLSAGLIGGLVGFVGGCVVGGGVVGCFIKYNKKCRNTCIQQNSYQQASQREEVATTPV